MEYDKQAPKQNIMLLSEMIQDDFRPLTRSQISPKLLACVEWTRRPYNPKV
jgi:hypothetical protein